MPILSIHDLSISFSGPLILEGVQLHIDRGERVCVVGRNGAGKSTLLKVIQGEYAPNTGILSFPDGGGVAALPQVSPVDWDVSVYQAIALGYEKEGESLLRFKKGEDHSALDPDRQWQMEHRIEALIEQFELEANASFSSLSGGQKRRVLLAKAIVAEPALLILDEPTNHMDLDSILWIENFLVSSGISLLFVTHDRAFLRKVATRIVEIDLGQLESYRCDYDTYLKRKEELLQAEEKERKNFAKKLSEEEAWLRKGVKARRTRNEGRVKSLLKMRAEHRALRHRQSNASFQLQEAAVSGQKVISAENVSFSYTDKSVLKPFDLELMRNDRIGIIGPNGSGKSTLLKLLLGHLQPSAGQIKSGTKLEVCYFDQMREQLKEDQNVMENVADGYDTVVIGGKQKHVVTYLRDFLFMPDRIRVPIRSLSGGERNRLLLAKLFTQPANFLVMDEPTNDLDAETLELLEELLLEFKGTMLLVSHDREFLNNTVTSIIAINKEGNVEEHSGGYDDWLMKKSNRLIGKTEGSTIGKNGRKEGWKKNKARKFSNKEQRELDELPLRIEELDQKKEKVVAVLADPATYTGDPQIAKDAKEESASIEAELEGAYARWEELEALKKSLEG
jgi:ATP-binding cassette subfamily F protein uup